LENKVHEQIKLCLKIAITPLKLGKFGQLQNLCVNVRSKKAI